MREERKNPIIMALGFLMLIAIFSSGFMNFLIVDPVNLMSYEVKGFVFVFFGIIVYVHGLITNSKKEVIIASIVAIIGHVYTLVLMKDLIFNPGVNKYATFGPGFYLYFIIFPVLIINTIIYLIISKKEKPSGSEYQIDTSGITGSYTILNYIYGVEKRPELFNKISIISLDTDNSLLSIIINSEELIKIDVNFDQIQNISIKHGIVMSNKTVDKEVYEEENRLFATALTGVWGPVIADNFMNRANSYSRLDMKQIFDIEIEFQENGENTKFMFQSKNNPTRFFEPLKDKIINN